MPHLLKTQLREQGKEIAVTMVVFLCNNILVGIRLSLILLPSQDISKKFYIPHNDAVLLGVLNKITWDGLRLRANRAVTRLKIWLGSNPINFKFYCYTD